MLSISYERCCHEAHAPHYWALASKPILIIGIKIRERNFRIYPAKYTVACGLINFLSHVRWGARTWELWRDSPEQNLCARSVGRIDYTQGTNTMPGQQGRRTRNTSLCSRLHAALSLHSSENVECSIEHKTREYLAKLHEKSDKPGMTRKETYS
jgi:hypothetical protein